MASQSFFCFVWDRQRNSIVDFEIGDRTKQTCYKLFKRISDKCTVDYLCTDGLEAYKSYQYNSINQNKFIPNKEIQLSQNTAKRID